MKLELFFDYACPYCFKGHKYLLELLTDYPQIEVLWRPCEAHPRPDKYGYHSDLCARGMYYVQNKGLNLFKYHKLMYNAAVTNKLDVENLMVLSNIVRDLFNSDEFYSSLSDGAYKAELDENNRLAWEEYRFGAVPSMVMNGNKLRSIESIGLTKEMIQEFLSSNLF